MIFGVMVTRKHDRRHGGHRRHQPRSAGAVAALAFFGVVASAILRTDLSALAPVEHAVHAGPRAARCSTGYLLAFEVASVLLLAAIVSAVVLARRRDPAPEAAEPRRSPRRSGKGASP